MRTLGGILLPILCLCLHSGCSALWDPFAYSDPTNCVARPDLCGAGFECNYQREVCEPKAALPTASRLGWRQQARFTDSNGAAFDEYGFAVSIYGETAVMGAHLADVLQPGFNEGAAYVYVRDPDRGTWTQQAKLTASDAQIADFLGDAASLYEDTLLLSATVANPDMLPEAGAAYIFVRDPSRGTWSERQKLTASDKATGDLFAHSVSLYQDTAFIGANLADVVGSNSGAVYVFTRDSGTGSWSERQKLVPSDSAPDDSFGLSAQLFGDTALIGSFGADVNGALEAGAAYVFVRNPQSGVWTERQKLVAADGAPSDLFGQSVALFGDLAAVGAPRVTVNGFTEAGAVYVFARDPQSGTWTQQSKIVPTPLVNGELFGTRLALYENRLAVSAVGAAANGQAKAGTLYIYTRLPGQTEWSLEASLVHDDPAVDDSAGHGMSLFGDTIGLGVSGRDRGADPDVGSAFIFKLGKQTGDPCASGRECHSTYCVDGVCCDSACGNGDPGDCQACSAAAGAMTGSSAADGTCRPRRPGQLCRAGAEESDPAESCDGRALTCPPDLSHQR